jgi:glycosyltransferase involved in cell wall biosynthesis
MTNTHPAFQLSVVLPCYNPPNKWADRVTATYRFLSEQLPEVELIVVNDGSTKNFTDAEEMLLVASGIKHVTYTENQGKGYALRKGVETAQGKYIIFTDIDFPYTHQSFVKVLEALHAGNDAVIGIRGEEYYTHLPKSRVYISKFLRSLIRFFLRIPTDDTQCGLKGFNQKGKEVFLKTTINRYLFDLEFVFLSAREKLQIKTVEVQLRPDVVLSKMNWKVLLQEFGNFLKIFAQSIVNRK